MKKTKKDTNKKRDQICMQGLRSSGNRGQCVRLR